jgi:ferredoxin
MNLCTGHGRCYRLAPDLFEPDEEDLARVKVDQVDADHRDLLNRVVKLCPEQAIRVEPLA